MTRSTVLALTLMLLVALPSTAQAANPTAVLSNVAPANINTAIPMSGASSSDPDGNAIVTYRWTLEGRAAVDTATASFNAPGYPTAGVYDVSLVVIDSTGAQSTPDTDTVAIIDNVNPSAAFTAPATIAKNATIPLNGATSSDIGGEVQEYRWTLTGRSVVVTAGPAYNAPGYATSGNKSVSLVVVDDSGNQSQAIVKTVGVGVPTASFTAPVSVGVNQTIPLNGTASSDSDPAGEITEYRWTVGGRPPVVTDTPVFNAQAFSTPGQRSVSLVVQDDEGNLSAATTKNVVVVDNEAPTAVIGAPGAVDLGAPIPLTGSSSFDGQGSIVEYRWTVAGRPPVVTADSSFSAPGVQTVGQIQASLVVVDSAGNQSQPTSRTIIVRDNVAPTAVLDVPSSVAIGAPIALSGARSFDAGGRIVTYRWTVPGRPVAETPDPAFVTPALPLGAHDLSLVVVDDAGNQSLADVKRVVVRDTTAPTAVLEAPGSVDAGAPIALRGGRSSDVGGQIVRYRWTVGSRAPVETTTATFNAPGVSSASVVVKLVVIDDAGNQSSDVSRTVTVGRKLTTFGSLALVAPIGKRTSQVDLGSRTLIAGRVVAPRAVRLTATFSLAGRSLGRTSFSVAAGKAARLKVSLSGAARRALAGRRSAQVRMVVKVRDAITGKSTTTTRTVTFTVSR